MLLFISPNAVGTAFVWTILLGFVAAVSYAIYQSNKADRRHRTNELYERNH